MKTIATFAGIVAAFLLFGISINAQPKWTGEYFFGEDGGKTSGGTKIYIAHSLKISKGNKGELLAHIYSQGYQTSIDIYATTRHLNGVLSIYFSKPGSDHVLGSFKKGDLLFTLSKSTIKGRFQTLTHWKKFRPVIDSGKNRDGIYFRPVREIGNGSYQAF